MAHIEIVAEIPHFRLLRTDSYLDDPASPWILYQVRPLFRNRPVPCKLAYMLSWHAEEKRLAPSSEVYDLRNHFTQQLVTWAETQIKMHAL
jgi:hypothetical protein